MKWCYNVYSDGQESKSVLEFVAVGGELTTPLYTVVNGGGNCHSFGGCSSRCADQRKVISASIPTIANNRNLAVWCAEACGGTPYHPAGHVCLQGRDAICGVCSK